MPTKKYIPVACYLTKDQIRAVKALAAQMDRPQAWVIRAAVDAYTKQHAKVRS